MIKIDIQKIGRNYILKGISNTDVGILLDLTNICDALKIPHNKRTEYTHNGRVKIILEGNFNILENFVNRLTQLKIIGDNDE